MVTTTKNTTIHPRNDKILVLPFETPEQSEGGIYVPDSARQRGQQGEVLAVGDGRLLDDGSRGEMTLHQGDKVLFSKYGGNEVTIEGTKYLILNEDDIYAVLK